MTKQERAKLVLEKLNDIYKDYPSTGLENWDNNWQLLFCIIMSARVTDDQVNNVTKTLFKKYPTLDSIAHAEKTELANDINSLGFHNSKADYLISSAQKLIDDFNGEVPEKISELVKLKGVARKSANVYQQVVFERSEGVAVDTHVARMSRRLELTKHKDPVKIENDLMKLFPEDKYHRINPILFWHGRTICKARKPQCEKCKIKDICPSAFEV